MTGAAANEPRSAVAYDIDNWGSTPTAEEFAAHHAAHAKGGTSWWVTIYEDEVEKGRSPYVWASLDGGRPHGSCVSPHALWSARDARLMPVTWRPTVARVPS